jgi:tight adherence protein B
MIPPIVLLLCILCLGAVILRADARNRRAERHLSMIMGSDTMEPPASTPRVRIQLGRYERFHALLYFLFDYVPDASYNWPAVLTVGIGLVAMIGSIVVVHMIFPWWMAVIAGLVTGCLVIRTLFSWQRDRYADKLLRQLPDMIEMTVSAVRAGLPVAEAFRSVSREMPEPTKVQFAIVVNEMSLGKSVENALRDIYHRTQVVEYAMLAVTLAVQIKSGGRLAETLQILGDAIRERVALAGRAKALAGEANLSMRVMSSLPFIAGSIMYFESPSFLDALFDDHRGRVLFGIAITSLTLGIVTMRRMIKKGTMV